MEESGRFQFKMVVKTLISEFESESEKKEFLTELAQILEEVKNEL